jgi:type II secretory ATPase GspE/PulE/Tfp pilus assembly ATPase PilB-like protein
MVTKSKDGISKLPIKQLLVAIIENGLKSDANFIHLEPSSDLIKIKYRVAGNLISSFEIPKKRFLSLSEKIKKLANIQIGYIDLISGGKFKYKYKDQVFNIRVYIVPTVSGEKITLKIQNDAPISHTLKELGFWGTGLETMVQSINLKNGLILITGPNDSGKSKTIATLLESVDNHNISIATLEDPVEYKISKATQTQINHKTNLSFAAGIKVLLKQDNDIIMISELTDSETINSVMNVVSHKKLVVSSLNVPSSVETISRILDYGIDSNLLAHSLRTIANQRLVRRLCPSCKQYVQIDRETEKKLNHFFDLNKPINMRYIHNLEILYTQEINSNKKLNSRLLSTSEVKVKKIWTNNPAGCSECNDTGFNGRTALIEVLKNSQEIEKLISVKSSDLLINKQAVREGMINLLVDGLIKSLVGETSIDEVIGITKTNYLT